MSSICILSVLLNLGAESTAWESKLTAIKAQRKVFAARLSVARDKLDQRARAEQPELLRWLETPPAKKSGYGLLPMLGEDPTEVDQLPPSETRYDMQKLKDWVAREIRFTQALSLASGSGESQVCSAPAQDMWNLHPVRCAMPMCTTMRASTSFS